MSVGVAEIDSATTVVTIDLAGLGTSRVGPVLQVHFFNPTKACIEIFLRNEKCEMLDRDMFIGLEVIYRDVVRQIDDQKMHKSPGFGKSKDLRKKFG